MYPPSQFDSINNYGTANNATVTKTFTGKSGYGICISGIAWSYNSTPTGGGITITDNGSTVFSIDITTSGAGFIPFNPAMEGSLGNNVVVTLAAGGANVVGKLTVLGQWLRPQ